MEQKNASSNLDKRKPKGPIKFNITLNEEQKQAKQQILHNTVTLLKGAAGQAVQNMNIMFGLNEQEGLKLKRITY